MSSLLKLRSRGGYGLELGGLGWKVEGREEGVVPDVGHERPRRLHHGKNRQEGARVRQLAAKERKKSAFEKGRMIKIVNKREKETVDKRTNKRKFERDR